MNALQAKQLPSSPRPPKRLLNAFRREIRDCRPVPPPLRLEVTGVPTFAVDLTTMRVLAPAKKWKKLKHLRALLRHEIKHASADGHPYHYRAFLHHAAALMKSLSVNKGTASDLLGIVYDAAVDQLVHRKYSMKSVQEEWLKIYPVEQSAGSGYHLLNVVYKDFFGVDIPPTAYEDALRTAHASTYCALKEYLKAIPTAKKDDVDTLIVRAAALVQRLIQRQQNQNQQQNQSRGGQPGQGQDGPGQQGQDQDQDQDQNQQGQGHDPERDQGQQDQWSRPDEDEQPPVGGICTVTASVDGIEDEAIEIAMDNHLSYEQLADFLDCAPEELEEKLMDGARKVLWEHLVAFRGTGSTSAVLEPYPQRWRPWDRTPDPDSVARHPHSPEKWKTVVQQPTLPLPEEGELEGVERIVIAVDVSSSTCEPHQGRSILAWEKDAAIGLIAFAKTKSLPVKTLSFASSARLLVDQSRDYLKHTRAVMLLTSFGSTDPSSVVSHLSRCDEGTLIAIITDGEFHPSDLRAIIASVRRTKVICALVGDDSMWSLQERNLEIYTVKPSSACTSLIARTKLVVR